ncbi:MAG: carbon starvation CstA family protein [Arthrobacter sp.]|uniref:carbon starvation CstA family protein n=1 Tax=unclassified Arthrobacter TaxID=235627 RepID=UPI00264F8422|nr:carbon starvation protein A [Micrococcaceae bacterium]MDN5822980.1 carbon starvation protein A [Micrococcaceae bacterium]MDN5878554.1 carbon starvation protein A [Micrococcaceae bacterium]MDN5886395.1 carbon starvation protein A [Micrococcaceae bacterium]MDN5904481.1 carbon starvation protein A [Micrococcaceae bacterium]
MGSLILMIIGLAVMAAGYLVYSKFLAQRVYKLDSSFVTPAHELKDGVDYMPTNKFILWGHHFTSVAGAAPIVGPAIAVIWGWLPALLWVTLGTVFFAGMHDLGTLWASTRNKGRSIGALSARYIGKRGANLFLVVIFLVLLMVIAAFAVVIKNLLISTPGAVIPVWGAIVVALLVGVAVYRLRWSLLPVTVVGVVVLYALIVVGDKMPVVLPESTLGMSPATFWILALFIYGAVASLLPVWVLLQPRDYINGVQLFVGLILLFGSVLLATLFSASPPDVVAPAINMNVPDGTPSMIPLLFVTIACGAISGFHGMVASGTTSKQLDKETDARFVGYFGAVGEGLLSLGTILAVIGGFKSVAEWNEIYSEFGSAGVNAFVEGGANLMQNGIGLPASLSATVLATMAVLFAATTMDTGMRLLRFVVQEAGEAFKVKIGKIPATLIVVVLGLGLTFSQGLGGEGGLRIWPLFGTTNQLMASLSLSIIAVILIRKGRNPITALIPLVIIFVMAFWAAIEQLGSFTDPANPDWMLFALDVIIIVASVWVAVEAILAMRNATKMVPEHEGADAELTATREDL